MERIILDTDIGTDVDDAIALAFLLKSGKAKLEGVTTAYGDVEYRAKVAQKIASLCGAGAIDVYNGAGLPLLRQRGRIGYGHDIEADVLELELPPALDRHASDFIIDTIMRHPGQITLLCIAPLTNIALAMIKEPRIISRVKQIVLMGGVARLGANGRLLPNTEYNVQCDPEAAAVVFSSQAPIVMIGLDVTLQVILKPVHRAALAGVNHPLNRELDRLITRWLSYTKRDWCAMHDPLAAAVALDRSLVRTERMRIEVEYDHRHPSGRTIAIPDPEGSVEVALEVDAERFLSLLLTVLK